ncbi:hypothetical protein HK405_000981, partial [Cladochytrium tenue]
DLQELSRVGRAWRDECDKKLWRDVTLDMLSGLVVQWRAAAPATLPASAGGIMGLAAGLEALRRKGERVRRVTAKLVGENAFEAVSGVGAFVLLQSCPGLQHLKIVRSSSSSPSASMKTLDTQFVHTLVANSPPSVTSLTIKMRTMSDGGLGDLLDSLPNLTDLSLICTGLSPDSVTALAYRGASSLKSLYLSSGLDTDSVAAIAKMDQLSSLFMFSKAG